MGGCFAFELSISFEFPLRCHPPEPLIHHPPQLPIPQRPTTTRFVSERKRIVYNIMQHKYGGHLLLRSDGTDEPETPVNMENFSLFREVMRRYGIIILGTQDRFTMPTRIRGVVERVELFSWERIVEEDLKECIQLNDFFIRNGIGAPQIKWQPVIV